ncbi:hypothetical protein ACAX43_12435 [Paraburkholderia sp. IW21]|uniref:portal protein n=1 Tax=Paraburkholderia sp. IW21 TaxID=3242488 RepID=UPI003521AFD8
MAKKKQPYTLDDNNPLFAAQDGDNTDAVVNQMNQILPGVLPKDEGQSIEISADTTGEDGPMPDPDVLAILNVHKTRARSFMEDDIQLRSLRSINDYYAQAHGDYRAPETPGRSNYVDSSVADTVNWLLPPLLDVFCGTDEIVRFTPRTVAQEKAADMTTAMVNHVWQQNAGYEIARTWIHDALWTPGGIIKVYWEPDLTTETVKYRGLTELQLEFMREAADAGEFAIKKLREYKNPDYDPLAIIQHGLALATGSAPPIAPQIQQQAQQGAQPIQIAQNVQVDPNNTEISENLYDVTIERKPDASSNTRGSVRIVNIPLEEFYFDPLARNVRDAVYSAHARNVTISDLRAMFPDYEGDLDEISSSEFNPEMSPTYLARTQLQGAYAFSDINNNVDPSMRLVMVIESYIKMDYDLDGIAEWRKIIHVGDHILLNEACDGNPFVLLVANPLPHLAFGISPAEQAHQAQVQQTELGRALIDNVRLGANAQMYAVDGAVNLDDLLDSRPGGIIRVKSADAVGVLQQGSGDVQGVTTLMELMDTMKQERTGVMKLTQGSDADIVNETATGYQAMTERSEQRIKLIARQFAETGFKPLALRIQKLLAQYQDEYMQIRLNGQLVEADPTDAANRFDVEVKVGLGTGDKAREIGNLQQILGLQQQALDQFTGMTNLHLVQNTVNKLVKAFGLNPEEYFCTPPSPMPQPPQPQVPPQDQIKLQIAQQQAQSEQQRQERQAQLDAMRIQAQAASDDKQAEMAHQRELQKIQLEAANKREQLIIQAAIQREQIAAQAALAPAQEQQLFAETYQSTDKLFTQALTGINMQMSGEMDDLINTIGNAPDPTGPQANPYQGGQQ